MRHRHALLHYRATRRHGDIQPCAGKTWPECYTIMAGRLTLWYNTADGSTHIIQEARRDVSTTAHIEEEARNDI